MKIVKLDRRHTGWGTWQYSVSRPYGIPRGDSVLIFLQWREWAWNQWGPSKELYEYTAYDAFDGVASSNPHWCWNIVDGQHRIYLRGYAEAQIFVLRWS